jgi:pimeloyl-ACP methyl ester carboxylesterase
MSILRLLSRVLLWGLASLLMLGLLALAIGPLLISPAPAPGVATVLQAATPDSDFVDVPADGEADLTLHLLTRNGPAPVAGGVEPTFVLLHGFTFNAFTWEALLDFFALYGPVLAYDQVPYGLSTKPLPDTWAGADPYSKAAALARLFALLSHFNIKHPVLVGNSSGGTLALEAARAQPERIKALILLSPWVYSKRPILPEWLVDLPQMQRVTLGLGRWLGTDSPLLDLSYADPSQIDARRRQLAALHRRVAAWDLAWGALLNRSLTDPVTIGEHLDAIPQPVLVITGSADTVVPVADTLTMAAALPDADLVVLQGCGHLPQEECPGQVAAAIRTWLAKIGLPATVSGDGQGSGGRREGDQP